MHRRTSSKASDLRDDELAKSTGFNSKEKKINRHRQTQPNRDQAESKQKSTSVAY